MHFLRNMERPAASVEERLADPDCHDDLVALLGGEDGYDDFEKEPVDLAAVRFRDRHDCVISAGALEKAGKEIGALLSELLVQIEKAADLGEEWNELVVRVALVCKTEVHPIGARLVNGDG
jgi:predicted hydrocarbon binding protein